MRYIFALVTGMPYGQSLCSAKCSFMSGYMSPFCIEIAYFFLSFCFPDWRNQYCMAPIRYSYAY